MNHIGPAKHVVQRANKQVLDYGHTLIVKKEEKKNDAVHKYLP